MTTASRTPLVAIVLESAPPLRRCTCHEPMLLVGEPEYHGGVVGDQTTLPDQQDAPYPRLLPPPRRWSSLPGRDQNALSGDVESWLGRQLTWR